MATPWFDHHCHLEPGDEAEAAVRAAAEAGVARLVCVGTDEDHTARSVEVARAHPGTVWATAGLHPHEARHGWGWVEAALAQDNERRAAHVELDALRRRYLDLTSREREVLPLGVSGLLNKQAAA